MINLGPEVQPAMHPRDNGPADIAATDVQIVASATGADAALTLSLGGASVDGSAITTPTPSPPASRRS